MFERFQAPTRKSVRWRVADGATLVGPAMPVLAWMRPREPRVAVRAVAALLGVAALVTIVLSPFLPAENQMGADAILTGLGILALIGLLGVLARFSTLANDLAWTLCPLLTVVALVALDVLTNDATVAAQIFFVFPVLYGASQLRPIGSAIMTGASLLGEVIVVAAQLPTKETVVQSGYVGAALVTASVMLTLSSERQAHLVARLEQMAAVDSLTGLVTRRVFDEAAASALSGASSEEGTALLLIDVDNFKTINDEFGHPGGDEVLVQLAQLMTTDIRRGDVVCRLGGDEIAVLMPGCSREDAHRRAEQILADVGTHLFELPGAERPVRVSVSMGVAHAPTDATELRALYAAADAALYRAKQDGRGRVGSAEV